jgi:hypothetical protein
VNKKCMVQKWWAVCEDEMQRASPGGERSAGAFQKGDGEGRRQEEAITFT